MALLAGLYTFPRAQMSVPMAVPGNDGPWWTEEESAPDGASRNRGRGKTNDSPISGGITNLAATFNLPMGALGDEYIPAFGANFDNMAFFSRYAIGIRAGYHFFKEKTDGSQPDVMEKTWYSIPFMLQGLYVFGDEGLLPYVGLGAGLMDNKDSGLEKLLWGVSPVGGVFYKVSDGFFFTGCVRLEQYLTESVIPGAKPSYVTMSLGIAFRANLIGGNSLHY